MENRLSFARTCPGIGKRVETARRDLEDDMADQHEELFGYTAGYNFVKIFDPTGGRNFSWAYSRQY